MNNLLATTLNENLAEIVEKLQSLMDSFWIYIVMALAAVVVIWGAYVGIKIAIAHKNEEKINLIKKEALSDEELENISGGGGELSYAIEAACAALGAYFASVAYDKSIGGFFA